MAHRRKKLINGPYVEHGGRQAMRATTAAKDKAESKNAASGLSLPQCEELLRYAIDRLCIGSASSLLAA
jgi:hypothetical protein